MAPSAMFSQLEDSVLDPNTAHLHSRSEFRATAFLLCVLAIHPVLTVLLHGFKSASFSVNLKSHSNSSVAQFGLSIFHVSAILCGSTTFTSNVKEYLSLKRVVLSALVSSMSEAGASLLSRTTAL